MKTIRLTLILILMLTVFTGCGLKDIDKRFFVIGIGLDQPEDEDNKIKVSLKLAIPPKESGKSAEFQVLTAETETITEAVRTIKSKVDKELDFGHTKIIVLGQKLVQNDVRFVFDWLQRRRDIQKIAFITVGKPSGLEVLNVKPPSETLPADSLILPFGQGGVESPSVVQQKLYQFYQKTTERGLDPILPIVEAKKEYFDIKQAGVFNKKKLKVELSKEETKMFNMINTGLEHTDVKIKRDNKTAMVAVEKASADYDIVQGKKPSIQMNIDIEGIVEEQTSRDPVTEKALQKYEKAGSKEVKATALSLLKKLQKENVDPIGFGLRYRSRSWNNDTEWEEWQSIYPTIDFKVKVDFKLLTPGIIK
ncbi:Ger(x)C family spore germination protein [Aquibacillus sp. 3ASR75-11]|uniref:Ger(X)C family spore germination protein n=1 Tax=Terrihalobacillus insolitus TaxID=2950438 RepID=A0A9X4AKJ6_9BACI|nr:Ger(x)C family spore germination protein [Terrihalobacillus insolitus]MDC3412403.1 Ger(x)C family spore germination protein [Terrihalobacillus insolitus]MDC3422904.1 Ger(x)C family spore germination protein [Terrihalobacillus insolitus]